MAESKIFISYSREDAEALEQVRPFLKPLQARGLIDVWDDTRLEGGDRWPEEIDQALEEAAVAVLFVSQDFLASDFITERELPLVLAAEHAGDLKVIPVFLRPSLADDVEYAFLDSDGEEHRVKLTGFQGYGTPARPLADLSWSGRERAYAKLAKQLRALSGEGVEDAPRHRGRVSRKTVTHEPAKLYVLTVRLERRGAEVHAEYSLPGAEPLASAATTTLEEDVVDRRVHGLRAPSPSRAFLLALGAARAAPRGARLAGSPWRRRAAVASGAGSAARPRSRRDHVADLARGLPEPRRRFVDAEQHGDVFSR